MDGGGGSGGCADSVCKVLRRWKRISFFVIRESTPRVSVVQFQELLMHSCIIYYEYVYSIVRIFMNSDIHIYFNGLQAMVDELCSGSCIALEICYPDEPQAFREFVGPADPVS